MAKQERRLVLTIGGTLLYPKKEQDKVKYALEITKLTEQNLEAKIKEMFPEYSLTIKENENNPGMYLLNIKTAYDVPVFDKDKNRIETPIYHGASVYANVCIKEYKYMNKKGITAYLSGIVLLENGEATSGQSFDSIMANVI